MAHQTCLVGWDEVVFRPRESLGAEEQRMNFKSSFVSQSFISWLIC
jgi:hypothetical protein